MEYFPEAAEALTILKAANLACHEDWKFIYCDSDAKAVIQALNNPSQFSPHWIALGFIKKNLSLLNSFNCINFVWSPRCNRFAHCVAKWGFLHSITGTFSPDSLPLSFVCIWNQEASLGTSSWFFGNFVFVFVVLLLFLVNITPLSSKKKKDILFYHL